MEFTCYNQITKIDKIDIKTITVAFTRYISIKMFRDKTELLLFKGLQSITV